MYQPKILIVGKGKSVIAELADQLNSIGYNATGTDYISGILDELQNNWYDLIAFGKAVRPEIRHRLEETFKIKNPELITVDGLYPSIPLLVDQIKLAFYKNRVQHKPLSYINYDINEGCLSVNLRATEYCKAEISLYRIGFLFRTHEQTLLCENLTPGDLNMTFDEKALTGYGSKYLVIRVNNQVSYMQRL